MRIRCLFWEKRNQMWALYNPCLGKEIKSVVVNSLLTDSWQFRLLFPTFHYRISNWKIGIEWQKRKALSDFSQLSMTIQPPIDAHIPLPTKLTLPEHTICTRILARPLEYQRLPVNSVSISQFRGGHFCSRYSEAGYRRQPSRFPFGPTCRFYCVQICCVRFVQKTLAWKGLLCWRFEIVKARVPTLSNLCGLPTLNRTPTCRKWNDESSEKCNKTLNFNLLLGANENSPVAMRY